MMMPSIEDTGSRRTGGAAVRQFDRRPIARQQLASQPETIGKFAHDLRGPLANLSLLVEAIEARGRATGDDKTALLAERAVGSIDRLDGMIRAVLARTDAGKDDLDFDPQPVSLPDVVEMAAALNQPLAEHNGVRLHCYLVEPLVVMGDADLLMRAVDNLLTNAIKFSPRGGMVICQLGSIGSEAVIRIEDEGPGIAQGAVRSTTKARGPLGSHGLGLSIVQQIVGRHGATLTAENSPRGRGAVLTLRIPVLSTDPKHGE